MNHLAYLACFSKINNRRLNKLAAYFFDLAQILEAKPKEIVAAGLSQEAASSFIKWRDANPPEKMADKLAREGIWTVALNEDKYPHLLAQINDPPPVIFVRGDLPQDADAWLSVVGTRRVTPYGRAACERLVSVVASRQVVIVSGLALGLDAIAHETALGAKGTTVAVLGSGIDRATVAPRAHQKLSERIISAGGALISEYPPQYPPDVFTFPMRNRIIAGLSQATFVVEAPRSSGALITASCALDYNREVLALPHQINAPMGEGCNMLIKHGAKMVTSAEEILDVFGITSAVQNIQGSGPDLSATEIKVLSVLGSEPRHLDAIIELAGISSQEAAAATAMLEIKNQAKNVGGMGFIKVF